MKHIPFVKTRPIYAPPRHAYEVLPRTKKIVKHIEEIELKEAFPMQNWNEVRELVVNILEEQHYHSSGNYDKTPCFLTAYQLAVLVNEKDSTLRGTLPIGGAKVGPDSFARQIAWHLSDDINRNVFNGKLEIQFLSLKGLDAFTFDGNHIPSTNEFSMFRLRT